MEPGSSTVEPYSQRIERNRKQRKSGGAAPAPSETGPRPTRWGWLLLPAVFFLVWRIAAAQQPTEHPAETQGLPATTVILINLSIVLVLTLLNGAFSMAETALLAVRRSRVEQMVEERRRGAKSVLALVENPPRYIATVQIGITLLGFAATAVAATAIVLADPFTVLVRAGWNPVTVKITCVAVVTFLVALVAMVFGEIAPKALAMQSPDTWALRLAPFVNVFAVLFTPISALILGVANLLVRPFGVTAQFETPMMTREEFEQILDEGKEHGEIDNEEKQIITNVFDLSETPVRSVMTPRTSMTALPADATISQMLETVLESGHSRIPVYENTIDNIVGIVHAKDLLPHLNARHTDMDLRSVMRQPYFVPETRKVSELLTEMRRSKYQLAIVQDEYAGTEGIVTIEDLLEEIVGEIQDEYDVDEPELRTISETEWVLDGRLAIADVNERLGFALPHKDYNTVGGMIFGLLGHEPAPGEKVRVDGVELTVETLEGRAVRAVRAVRLAGTEDAQAEGEDGEGV